MGGQDAGEDRGAGTAWPAILQPAGDRLAGVLRQRQPVLPAGLAVHGELPGPPVDVAQAQRGDLAGAQPEPRQDGQDREVPAPGRASAIAAAEQPPDICGADRPGQPGQRPAGDRRHRRQQAGPGQPFELQVAQERAQARADRLGFAHRSPLADRQDKAGHRRGSQAVQLARRPGLHVPCEPAGDADVLRDARLRRQAPLLEQVAPVPRDQRASRSRGLRLSGRDRAGAAQVVKQRRHAGHRRGMRVALRLPDAQEPPRASGGQVSGRQVLSRKPAAQVHHQPQMPPDRVGRVPLTGQRRLEPRAVRQQRPVKRTAHTPGHDRFPSLVTRLPGRDC